jgi:hypothetical protein
MPSVLSGLQRDVASALPGCDYHDLASFGLERRRIFQRKWFGADRASTHMAVSPSPRTQAGPGLPVMERLARVILGSRRIPAAGGPVNPRLDPASRPAVNQEGQHGRGPDPIPAAIVRLSGDTCEPWALAGRRGHS